MKKFVICLMVSFLMLSVMLGFASGKQDPGSEKITLELWRVTGGVSNTYWEGRIREFEKLYPNVTVKDESQFQTEFEKKLPTAIASGIAPAIWTQTYRSVVDYAPKLQPITDEIAKFMGYTDAKAVEAAWNIGAISQYIVDGKIYGFPNEIQYFLYAINKQHFIDAGLDPAKDYPKTWDDIITVGKKLTQWKDGRISRQAVTFPYNGPIIFYIMVMQPMLVERGINFFNADGTECLFNRPEVADAMRHLKRRFDEGVTDRALSTTEDVMSALGTGDNSMGFCTVGWINSWETAYPQTKGQLMLIPNPAWPGTTPMHAASTWAYSVNVQNRDTEKAWAWKLIDYMTGDPESAMKEINTLLPRTGWEKTEWAKQIKNVDMMALASQSSFPSGSTIHWPELQIPVQRAMQRILFENADIQTELDRATAEVNEAIRNKR